MMFARLRKISRLSGFELPAQRADDFRACEEHVADRGVRDEVEIALPVAGLDVFQAMPLLGHREHGFGEEIEMFDVDAELVGLGAEKIAFDADQIAQIEELVERKFFLADGVLADVNLELFAILEQVREAGLAHAAHRHDAPRDADLYARL